MGKIRKFFEGIASISKGIIIIVTAVYILIFVFYRGEESLKIIKNKADFKNLMLAPITSVPETPIDTDEETDKREEQAAE